jgi:ribonuclease P protein component
MLSKKNKLSAKLFSLFGRSGRLFHSDNLTLRYGAKVLSGDDYKVSVVVSRKVSPKAVQRNLLKRKVFSIVRNSKENLKPKSVYIFYLKKTINGVEIRDIEKEVNNLLRKV